MNRKLSLMLSATLIASTLILPTSAVGKRFSDVPDNHWASESISYAVDKGYFSGTSPTTFAPDGTMTRAMLWTVLSRIDDAPATVAPGQPWYQSGRNWAMANGISDGTNP
ncbi:MAG: S-layer homology domain-containing protein, partial [Clostridiales bacterium]|nr:S-layer homology domain-containing protein [Clostridiales bacterium]